MIKGIQDIYKVLNDRRVMRRLAKEAKDNWISRTWLVVQSEVKDKPVAYTLATVAAFFSIVSNILNIVDRILTWI